MTPTGKIYLTMDVVRMILAKVPDEEDPGTHNSFPLRKSTTPTRVAERW